MKVQLLVDNLTKRVLGYNDLIYKKSDFVIDIDPNILKRITTDLYYFENMELILKDDISIYEKNDIELKEKIKELDIMKMMNSYNYFSELIMNGKNIEEIKMWGIIFPTFYTFNYSTPKYVVDILIPILLVFPEEDILSIIYK